MKALDELREWAEALKEERGGVVRWHCDAIERELTERYMELPLDMDGVSWHIGDIVNGHGTVQSMGLNRYGWHFVGVENAIDPALHRHAKPDTVEDVLRELTEEWNAWDGCDSAAEQQLFAKYVERIERMVRNDRL